MIPALAVIPRAVPIIWVLLVPISFVSPAFLGANILPATPPIIAAAAIFRPAFCFCSSFITRSTSAIVGGTSFGTSTFSIAGCRPDCGNISALQRIVSPAATVVTAKTAFVFASLNSTIATHCGI